MYKILYAILMTMIFNQGLNASEFSNDQLLRVMEKRGYLSFDEAAAYLMRTEGAIPYAGADLSMPKASRIFHYTEAELLGAIDKGDFLTYEDAQTFLDSQAAQYATRHEEKGSKKSYTFTESQILETMELYGLSTQDEAARLLIANDQNILTDHLDVHITDDGGTTQPVARFSREISEKLQCLFLSAKNYDNINVHIFNQHWSKTNIAAVLEVFHNRFQFPPVLAFDDLEREILVHNASVATALNLFKVHGGGAGYADAESGVRNTLEMLSWNWHLANTDIVKHQRFTYQFQTTEKNGTLKDFIVDSLLENAATGGGCAPGYSGRFVRDMLIILCVYGNISEQPLRYEI